MARTELNYSAAFVRTRGVDTKARSIEVVASDESIDRYGEIIDQRSWKLDRYKQNPVVLFMHRQDQPVGRAEDVRLDGLALHARVVFAKTDRGNELLQLFHEGALRAVSVGFRVGRIAAEQVNGRAVDRLCDCELLEISAVSVPANPNAVAKHKSLGLVPRDVANRAGESLLRSAEAAAERAWREANGLPPANTDDPARLPGESASAHLMRCIEHRVR